MQLLLWTILPLGVALIVLSFAGVFRHRQVMRHMVEDRDQSLVLAEANSLARAIERRTTLLTGAAGALDPASPNVPDLERLMTLAGIGPDDGLALFDAQGRVTVQSPGGPTGWANQAQAASLAARVLALRQPQLLLLNRPGANAAPGPGVTDQSPDAERALPLGVPAAGARALLASLSLNSLALGEAGQHLLTEIGGQFSTSIKLTRSIMRPTPEPRPSTARPWVTPCKWPGPACTMPEMSVHGGSGRASFTYLQRPGHEDLLLVYAPIDPLGWTLVTTEDMSQMNGAALSVAEVLPMVLLFFVVLALLAVSFGVAAIVRPLQDLDRRAARVAWGDFDAVEGSVGGIQEIDDLRATLAQMATRIRTYQLACATI